LGRLTRIAGSGEPITWRRRMGIRCIVGMHDIQSHRCKRCLAIERGYVEIQGDWLNDLWTNWPILVPDSIDVPTFLGQSLLPMLFPNDKEYIARTEREAHETAKAAGQQGFAAAAQNPQVAQQLDLGLQWIIVLLHHPSAKVVRDTINFWDRNWSKYVQSTDQMPYRTLLLMSISRATM
jgi:hypothetical protein